MEKELESITFEEKQHFVEQQETIYVKVAYLELEHQY